MVKTYQRAVGFGSRRPSIISEQIIDYTNYGKQNQYSPYKSAVEALSGFFLAFSH